LADQLGVKMGAVLPGSGIGNVCATLTAHGADNVYLVDDKKLTHYQTGSYCRVLTTLIEKHRPQIVVFGATAIGRDLAPRVASTLRAGLTADCTDLEISDVTEPKTKVDHKNLLLQIRPAFGGNIIATIVNFDQWPQMATVREGVMAMKDPDPTRTGKVVEESVAIDDTDLALKLIERHLEARKINLKGARVIVAGGGGIGSKDNFQLLYDLAGSMGGAVGASRAAVDGGLIGKEHQVGQTGTTVRPALYIAVGISGAIQHRSGMEESAKIIAINKDPDAPIFSVAHYGIVGDFRVVLPKMIKAIRERG
jgi:electron transfer flavoprotein alpha subunit